MSSDGQSWKSLDPPHAVGSTGAQTAPANGVVYYQYRDSMGETHIVDDLTLVPREVKHVQKLIMQRAPVAPPQAQQDLGANMLKSAQNISQEAFASMASHLGVTPPAPIAEVAQQPITASTALVPTVPPMQHQSFSPGTTVVTCVALMIGLSNRHTRRFSMRILVMGISMAALGSVYFNWANAHGFRPPPGMPATVTPASVMQAAEINAKNLQKHQQDEVEMLDSIERTK